LVNQKVEVWQTSKGAFLESLAPEIESRKG
jgi:hypothetical protein